ncbi:hypothetical protein NDU88_008478 [Pleurodeles waltl]|uniref:Uncharacterized protein n=1 Tax=Pleurodeles waltl TaxID=8319 RepID=A0AAV7PP89_PLEWA|nr:hypothetical protein NDU88_008478 [Pleurodeles waltl]
MGSCATDSTALRPATVIHSLSQACRQSMMNRVGSAAIAAGRRSHEYRGWRCGITAPGMQELDPTPDNQAAAPEAGTCAQLSQGVIMHI